MTETVKLWVFVNDLSANIEVEEVWVAVTRGWLKCFMLLFWKLSEFKEDVKMLTVCYLCQSNVFACQVLLCCKCWNTVQQLKEAQFGTAGLFRETSTCRHIWFGLFSKLLCCEHKISVVYVKREFFFMRFGVLYLVLFCSHCGLIYYTAHIARPPTEVFAVH